MHSRVRTFLAVSKMSHQLMMGGKYFHSDNFFTATGTKVFELKYIIVYIIILDCVKFYHLIWPFAHTRNNSVQNNFKLY